MNVVTVREEFSSLKDFTSSLPSTFDRRGVVMHNGRNVIKKIDTPQGSFVVKNFKGMYLFNRLAYSFFRKSKAARSYVFSRILNEKGVVTPPHVGWIDCYTLGLLKSSYFISVYYPYMTLGDTLQYYSVYDPNYKSLLLKDLARYIKRLHSSDIYHQDLSVGNILVIRKLKGYDFALVDLNRVKFQKVNFSDALRNLTTLRLDRSDLDELISEYAMLCGEPAQPAIETFWKYENRKSSLRRLRRKIRRYTITKIEQLLGQAHTL
jgi:serine/threonine protein kinase